jgi:hypothetical protein
MMRTKLGLTDTELMNTPWIALTIAMNDFPWIKYKTTEGKKDVKVNDQDFLNKMIGKHK